MSYYSIHALRAMGNRGPLTVKRVPRNATHPLTRFVAAYDTPPHGGVPFQVSGRPDWVLRPGAR